MRFTCEKNMLVTGLNIAGRTVAQKSSLSVIEGILCKAGQGLSLTGYNMETAITYEIDADVSDMGQCILPAKLFGDIIRRLPEGPVTADDIAEQLHPPSAGGTGDRGGGRELQSLHPGRVRFLYHFRRVR